MDADNQTLVGQKHELLLPPFITHRRCKPGAGQLSSASFVASERHSVTISSISR